MKSLLLVLFLFSTSLFAQNTVRHVGEFPVSRYQGGPQAFYQTLAKTLEYPRAAREAGRVGTSIVSLTLSPEGTFADLTIINPLGKGIDEDILETFRETENQWLAMPGVSSIQMYFVITYMTNDQSFYRLVPNVTIFQEEIVVNAHGSTPRRRSRDQLIEKLYKFRERKKFKKALRFADELVRRDPLNKDWYLQRSNINDALGNQEAVCQDLLKIRDFLEASVTQELIQQYCD